MTIVEHRPVGTLRGMSDFQSTRFQHTPTRTTRGGGGESFAVSPFAVLLIVVLAGLCAFISYYRISNTGPGTGLISTHSTSKIITMYVTIFLVAAAVSGGIGALCYFVGGRRASVANGGICVTLLIAIGALGYGLYNNIQNIQSLKDQLAARRGNTPNAPGSASSSSPSSSAFPRPGPSDQRPSPVTPSGTNPPPLPITTAPNATPPATDRPASTRSPAPLPAAPAADAQHAQVLDALRDEVEKDFSDLATKAQSVLTELKQRPTHDRKSLDERLQSSTQLNTDIETLRKRVMNISEEARERLVKAGVDETNARTLGINLNATAGWSLRLGALARLGFAADAGADEAKLLLERFADWRIAGGEYDSKDFALKSRLRGARLRTESTLRDTDKLVDELTKPARP